MGAVLLEQLQCHTSMCMVTRSIGSDTQKNFYQPEYEKIVCETVECGLQSFHQTINKIDVYELIL